MHAAALRLELRIPNVRSLKEKRHKVKSLIALLSSQFPVVVCEVGFQDQWQRTTLGAAVVAPQAGHLERIMHSVRRCLVEHTEFELLEVGIAYLEEQ
ncbi:MAG: DUF503 domain-containing protein [Acidimicrobiia bacterium]